MEDDLAMKGSTPLNIAIFAVGCLIFGGTLYGLTRSSEEQREVNSLEKQVEQAKGEENGDQKDKGEFAKMEAGAPAKNEPAGLTGPEGAAPAPANEAPTATPPADPAVGAGTPPPPQPQASNDAGTPPPAAMANAAPTPEPAATPTAASMSEPTAAASSDEAAKEVANVDDEPNPPVNDTPKPSAMGVLTPWWQASQASPFNVQFVGRSEDEKKIVILFNQEVDAAAASGKIRVLDDKGKPVDSNWQQGENPRVLVNGDLDPGRYLVLIEPTLSGAQGQPVGVPLHGPVVLQPDSQTS